ncbi:glycoside hydrolase family 3 C-terminal domain-containing protein [Actinacidiphila acididurans]|uniref:Glycoside hydrolase family 3 C-terminal domain-containing protein n=1 Tax=Actinacidiphila acididurans TaxID=2784346 RepID=A0ABS2TVZ7_9ACTN|nr:glycoside hydrolase family 3 C-terminal domain-containing protein [Actinacidiphila acididurans]MBM9506681.1 glycoside hydrolase family 3 C-terminal domain-containing protein [Actinacidiphila acididurans]
MRRMPRRHALMAAGCALVMASAFAPVAQAASAPAAKAAPQASSQPIYLNTQYSDQARAADLVSRMTLAEKVAQLSTNSGPAIPRLGVQQYTYWSEGQHGINTLGADQNNGGVQGGVHATSFPTNFAASMSWDPALMYQETTAISDEARGFLDKSLFGTGQNNLGPSASDYGSLTYWAPTVNMDRDPRWGRTDEAFGEDPYLVGQMAGQFVDGYEGNNPDGTSKNGYLKVAATAKHYALNDTEQNRTGITSNASDTAIRDYYTAQFRSLIENAHVSGLMTSYNAINGTPAVADTYTANQLAQRTYGFNGYVTSDCGAVGTTYDNPPSGHAWAPPGWTTDGQGGSATWTNTATGAKVSGQAGGQAYALRAGTDLNCTGFEATTTNIQAAINAGILSEGVIDADLTRVFTVRMQTGEFDPAGSVPYTSITKAQIQSPAHQALATTVADNSLVLLKNANVASTSTPLLPADPAKLNHVVILGDMANSVTLGDYSGEPGLQVNAVQGLTSAIKAVNPNATITFDAAGTSSTSTSAAVLSSATQTAIKNADLVLLFVGTNLNNASEGTDRSTIAMPGNYDSLINQTTALGNPRTALVIQSNGPVKIDDVQDKVPAVVFSGYNGESQGTALADVLLGRQNPSGHLNFTWYKDDSQLPPMSAYGLTPGETGGLGRTYQYFTGTPTYPFGYGLSYSSFSYSAATADRSSVTADGSVNVSFTVTNTGSTAGATVAELYAATPFTVSGVQLPTKRLEGFRKTNVLAPGASQQITIPVKVADLAFWNATTMKSTVYDGTYQFQVGGSSAAIASSVNVAVTGAITPKVQYVTVQPENLVYNAGSTLDLTGKNRWIKDDTTGVGSVAQGRDMSVTADDVVEAVNNDQSFVNLSTAQVSYSSSDTSVATVSSAGLVRAVGDGVATITVTVNGVSGSVPIVVRHSVTLNAPALTTAGGTVTATTSYVNGGTAAVSNVALSLTAPSGWTAQATGATSFASVAGGQSVQTTWRLTAPAGAGPGSYALSAGATATGTGPFADSGAVNIAYPSVTAAFGNTGISDDANTTAGNFDGGGASYSAQALAAAGLTPGGAFHHDGVTFTWPNVAAGTPDNIVAGGQTVPLSGSGSTLSFIGSAAYGTASGSGTVVYTDGTTQPYSLAFGDWWSKTPLGGTDIAAALPYINNGGGKATQPVNLYYASVPITAGKTVQAVVLPNVSSSAASNTVAMHIFAMTVSSPAATTVVSLRAHANNQIVTADNAGASPLIANRTSVGQWESFDLLTNSDGSVSLRSHANNEIVTADNAGAAPLIANRTAVGPWESFDLLHNSDGSVSFRAHANNEIVTADNAGASPLIANRTSVGPWEEFDLIYD